MYSKEIKEEIHEKLHNKDGRLIKKSVIEKDAQLQSLVQNIYNLTNFLDSANSLKSRIYCIIHDITIQPLCKNPNCSNIVTFRNSIKGFNTTCSPKCKQIVFRSPMKNKKMSKHARQKLSESCKGRIPWNKGKSWDDTVKEKMKGKRESITGKNHPLYGKQRDPIVLHKISTSLKKTWAQKDDSFFSEVYQKGLQTKIYNHSLNSSLLEDEIYFFLKSYYQDIIRHYTSSKYPFECDFYIPSLDMYIELQGNWTHGGRAFLHTLEDMQILQSWKEKSNNSDYYANAIYVWTNLDVRKREIAKNNNLRYLEIFDYSDVENIICQIQRVHTGLTYTYSDTLCRKEISTIQNKKGDYTSSPIYNKNVLSFQNSFFEKENMLWKYDPIIRRKLIQNRMYYLDKKESELTDKQLLRGFKISGIHQGYSHFSPLWIKAFIQEYGITSLYDPCGGWGHRLLGCYDIDYIYNDLNNNTYHNVMKMEKSIDSNSTHKFFYNKDASQFTPPHMYDAVFTCPPYFQKENYGVWVDPSYDRWINYWWRNVIKKSTMHCSQYFAFVMCSEYLSDMKEVCQSENLTWHKDIILGGTGKSHFQSVPKNSHILSIFTL